MNPSQTVGDFWKERPNEIRRFLEQRHAYEKLCDEVAFVLENIIRDLKIEFASISKRAKTLNSFCEKVVRRKYEDPFTEMTDLSGVRIVYLYSSDKSKIEKSIRKQFVVIERTDRIQLDGADKFGYGAMHFLVRLGKKTKGARYDALKDLVCEIQVRTILQDAWATVAHHLSYKQETDVPIELRRKLNALAGLFETADDQFNRLNLDRGAYSKLISEEIKTPGALAERELNVDSLAGFIKARYKHRKSFPKSDVTDLLPLIKTAGISNLFQLEKALQRAQRAFDEYETRFPPGPDPQPSPPRRFTPIGVVRVSIIMLIEKSRHEQGQKIKPQYLDVIHLIENG
jgi:putative GTP pyrophosphokinase